MMLRHVLLLVLACWAAGCDGGPSAEPGVVRRATTAEREWRTGETERVVQLEIPEGLERDQKLPELLITPSTKGILEGIPGVPAVDDVNITRADIQNNYRAFNFRDTADVDLYERLLREGFDVISGELAKLDQIFVDTKFEFGYVTDRAGNEKLIYMDEVGTPDSSRIWDGAQWRSGKVVENSKEGFRQLLLQHFPDPDILLNKDRMDERQALACDNALRTEVLMEVSATYTGIAEKIIGRSIALSDNPTAEIIDVLKNESGLVD